MLASRIVAALKARPFSEVRHYAVVLVRNALGLPNRMRTPDRETLEEVILPAYASRPDIRTVLFVGCAWYTRHYQTLFRGRDYLTIDPDPWKRRFGARRHVVAGLESLSKHVASESLDLIVCNGVFGWGLDERDDCERAFAGCFDALKPGGEMLIGWNDVPEHRPLELDTLKALARFKPQRFEPLGSSEHLTDARNRHTFSFYAKP